MGEILQIYPPSCRSCISQKEETLSIILWINPSTPQRRLRYICTAIDVEWLMRQTWAGKLVQCYRSIETCSVND